MTDMDPAAHSGAPVPPFPEQPLEATPAPADVVTGPVILWPDQLTAAGITPDMARIMGGIDVANPQTVMFLGMMATMIEQTALARAGEVHAARATTAAAAAVASAVAHPGAGLATGAPAAPAAEAVAAPVVDTHESEEPAPAAAEAPDTRTEIEKLYDTILDYPYQLIAVRQGGRARALVSPAGKYIFDEIADRRRPDPGIGYRDLYGKSGGMLGSRNEVVGFGLLETSLNAARQQEYASIGEYFNQPDHPSAKSPVAVIHWGAYMNERAQSYAYLRAVVPYEVALQLSELMGNPAVNGPQDQHPEYARGLVQRLFANRYAALVDGDTESREHLDGVLETVQWVLENGYFSGDVAKVSDIPSLAAGKGGVDKLKGNKASGRNIVDPTAPPPKPKADDKKK